MLDFSFRLLLGLAVVHFISACASAVVGGTAHGGYPADRQGYSSASNAKDAAISREVNARIVKDPLVSAFDVHVTTRNGVVNLAGTVPSQRAAERAVSLASTVGGAVRVVSQLKVAPGETRQ